jgi:hypothetical protein
MAAQNVSFLVQFFKVWEHPAHLSRTYSFQALYLLSTFQSPSLPESASAHTQTFARGFSSSLSLSLHHTATFLSSLL